MADDDTGGCCGCLIVLLIVWLLSAFLEAIIAVLPVLVAVSLGVVVWFVAREIWRQFADQKPNEPWVRSCASIAPVERKLLGALVALAVSVTVLLLMVLL